MGSYRCNASLLDPASYPPVEELIADGDEERLRDFYLDTSLVGPPEEGMGPIGNTAPTTLQMAQEPGGFDTIEVNVYGRWTEGRLSELGPLLDEAQVAAAAGGDGWVTATVAGEQCEVCAGGAKRGGLYCRWYLQYRGMRFAIARPKDARSDKCGVHVDIGSLVCMELGGPEAWRLALEFVERLGLVVSCAKASRVDLCVDLAGVRCHDVCEDYALFKVISRGLKGKAHFKGYVRTGFVHGSGRRIMLRIYDKRDELGDSVGDRLKESILAERRWGGRVPQFATRVEFQLRREAIRDFGVDTIEEVFARAGEMARWLTHVWFRMTRDVPDRRHTDRSVVSEFWAAVQAAFAAAFGSVRYGLRRVKRCRVVDPGTLWRQGFGCFATGLALLAEVPATLEVMVQLLAKELRRLEESFVERVAQRRREIDAMRGVEFEDLRVVDFDSGGAVVRL